MTDVTPTAARLTITYNGQQGDLPDAIPFDTPDADIKQIAAESIETGYVSGIDAFQEADFTDFVVDRFPAREDIPVNRIALRPKTPFGTETTSVCECPNCGELLTVLDMDIADGSTPLCPECDTKMTVQE